MCSPQSQFFWNKYYTQEMDDVFVDALLASLNDNPYRITMGSITAAQRAVNEHFGKRLPYRLCLERYNHLRKRHSTFAWLISQGRVLLIPRWRQLWADEESWGTLGRERPFALAHRWRPEPKWEALKLIFGQPSDDELSTSEDRGNHNGLSNMSHTSMDTIAHDHDETSNSAVDNA